MTALSLSSATAELCWLCSCPNEGSASPIYTNQLRGLITQLGRLALDYSKILLWVLLTRFTTKVLPQHFTWPNTSMTSLIGGTTSPEGVITIIIQNRISSAITFLEHSLLTRKVFYNTTTRLYNWLVNLYVIGSFPNYINIIIIHGTSSSQTYL